MNEVQRFVNDFIAINKCVMLKFKNGRVYLLRDHWKHLDPEDAPLVLIGKAAPPRQMHERPSNREPFGVIITYVTEPIKWS